MNPELEKILNTISDKSTRDKAKALFDEIIKGTRDFDAAIEVVNTKFGRGVDTVNELRKAIQASSDELRGTSSEITIQRKAYRDVGKALDGILYRTSGIEKGTVKQLEKDKLLVERAQQRLKATGRVDANIQNTIDRLDEEINFQEKVNDTIGLTGAAFDNLNRIGQRAFGGLGINLGALDESFKDVSEAIREQGELIAASAEEGEKVGTLANRFRTFGAALQPLGKGLKDVFTDPLILLKGIADAFFDINKASVALSRETGQGVGAFDSLNTRAATTVDLMEVIVEASKQTGLNIQNVFSADILAGAAEFKRTMGGTAEEAVGLLDLTAATGMTTDTILENTVDTVNTFNAANKAAISQRAIMRDVLSASTAVKASLAGNPTALAEAATAARRLGLSLSEVDSIAGSLLDFESSINNELEAQLLTGRNLNLTKARELALNNDLAGLSNEIFKNQVSVAEFSRMNRIQQDALAQSLGMSRDQLAKMAFQQAKLNGLTSEQAAAAAGVSLADMQRVEIQENFQMALQKTLQAFYPILNTVGNFLSLPYVPQLLIWGTISAKVFSGISKSVFGLDKSLGSVIGKFLRLDKIAAKLAAQKTVEKAGGAVFDKAVGRYRDSITGRFVKGPQQAAATLAEKVKNPVEALQKGAAGKLPPNRRAGMGLRFFFTNLGRGLGAFGIGAAPAIPVLLSIAAVAAGIGAAFAGLGFGINQAAEGIVNLTNNLTLDKVKTLYAAAGAIGALSTSLASLALFGTLAIPALLAVTPLLTALNPAGEAGEAEAQNSMAKIEEKLDKLITIVEKGGNVYLDGNAVGTAQVLGTFKSA